MSGGIDTQYILTREKLKPEDERLGGMTASPTPREEVRACAFFCSFATCPLESKSLFLYINTRLTTPINALLPSMPKLPLLGRKGWGAGDYKLHTCAFFWRLKGSSSIATSFPTITSAKPPTRIPDSSSSPHTSPLPSTPSQRGSRYPTFPQRTLTMTAT